MIAKSDLVFTRCVADDRSVIYRTTRTGRTIGYIVATDADCTFQPVRWVPESFTVADFVAIVKRCKIAQRTAKRLAATSTRPAYPGKV